MEEYGAVVYDRDTVEEMEKRRRTMKDKGKRRMSRVAGWLFILFLIVFIVPVGVIMFIISGLWTALDRAFLRLNSKNLF